MEKSRVEKKKIPAALIAVIVVIALAAVAAGAYLGLCRWVQTNGRLLPGVTAVDDSGAVVADLGGMDQADAAAQVAHAMDKKLQTQSLTVRYGESKSATLSGTLLAYSPDAAVASGMDAKAGVPFWKLGALWLGMVKEPTALTLTTNAYSQAGETETRELASRIDQEVYTAPIDNSVELDEAEENVIVVKGTDGQEAVTDNLVNDVLDALTGGRTELTVETRPVPCGEITAEMVNDLIYVEPQAPTKDENGNMVPAVLGVSIDTEAAQAALDAIGPGESCTIPLVHTPPEIETGEPGTAENPYAEGIYYNDLLAGITTNLDGVATRSYNVGLSAKSCNGKIIAPGETFSYLNTIGSPSAENGYKMSTGYQGGKVVDMVGGGVCQASSSLYYCAVYANLEIVTRAAHAFIPGYVPSGLDATVYYPSLDFKFKNNTGYPIKVVAYTTGGAWGTLTVRLYGTNPDGHYVKTERYTTATHSPTTVYKPDTTIPRGTTKVDSTPCTGYEVDVYRLVYSANGALLSRTFENHSRYAKRDKVILYNPADSGPWGEGGVVTPTDPPVTEPPATEPPVEPTPTPDVQPTPTPDVQPTPTPEQPEPTPDVQPTPAPEQPDPTPDTQPTPAPEPEPTPNPEPAPEQPAEPAPGEEAGDAA